MQSLHAYPEALVISERGKFIETKRGEFIRAASIDNIGATIVMEVRPKVKSSNGLHFADREFPLSLAGIKEFKELDRTEMIKEFGLPEAKIEDFEFEATVSIQINKQSHTLIEMNMSNQLGSWDNFEKAAKEAVGMLDRLIMLASKGEQAAPSDGEKPAN